MEEKKEKKGIFYGWYIVAVCTIVMGTIVSVSVGLGSMFLVPITESLGISRSTYSLASMVSSFAGIVLSPIIGKKMGKGGIRKYMTIGMAAATGLYFIRGYMTQSWHLYLISLCIGSAFVFMSTLPVALLVSRWFVKGRSMALSITAIGSSVGNMIFSPIITWLMGNYSWRTAHNVIGLALLVVLTPLTWFVIRDTPAEKGLTALGADEAAAGKGKPGDGAVGLSLAEARKTKAFWLYLAGLVAIIITIGGTRHMPANFTDMGFTAANIALYVSVYNFVAIFSKLLMGVAFDKLGLTGGIAMGVGATLVQYVLLLFMKVSMPALMIQAFIGGIASARGTMFPPILTSKLFGTKHYGEIFGWVNSVTNLAMAFNNPIVAFIYDGTGSYTVSWEVIIAMCVVSMITLGLSVKSSKGLLASSEPALEEAR